MAGSPKYKVFTPDGEYVASCKHPEDAAALVSARGDGATVRLGHSARMVLWREGAEDKGAGESYDYAALVIKIRESAIHDESFLAVYGSAVPR